MKHKHVNDTDTHVITQWIEDGFLYTESFSKSTAMTDKKVHKLSKDELKLFSDFEGLLDD